MDTAKWPQPMNEILTSTCLKPSKHAAPAVEKKEKPEKDEALNCPRCKSFNTKFCYYNNYSLTQPRYFCKNCRKYWTEGGSLRNIPVGGGVRKNKRSSSKKPLLVKNKTPPPPLPPVSHKIGENVVQKLPFSQEFGIDHHQSISGFLQVLPSNMKNNSLVSTSSALELLGISSSSNSPTADGFGLSYPQLQEFMRPALGFSLIHQENGSNGNTNGIPLLPFESLKLPVSSSSTNSDHDEHEKEEGEADQTVGFWNSVASSDGSWQ